MIEIEIGFILYLYQIKIDLKYILRHCTKLNTMREWTHVLFCMSCILISYRWSHSSLHLLVPANHRSQSLELWETIWHSWALLSWFKYVSHVKGSSMHVTSPLSNWNTSSLGSSNLICPEKIQGSSQYSTIRVAASLFTFLPNKVTSFSSSPTLIRKAVPFF